MMPEPMEPHRRYTEMTLGRNNIEDPLQGELHTTLRRDPLLADVTPENWQEERTVTIPACNDHAGDAATTVTIRWVCPRCGGPRGPVKRVTSYDGSRQLACDGWTNPCGHVDLYSDVRIEAAAASTATQPDAQGQERMQADATYALQITEADHEANVFRELGGAAWPTSEERDAAFAAIPESPTSDRPVDPFTWIVNVLGNDHFTIIAEREIDEETVVALLGASSIEQLRADAIRREAAAMSHAPALLNAPADQREPVAGQPRNSDDG